MNPVLPFTLRVSLAKSVKYSKLHFCHLQNWVMLYLPPRIVLRIQQDDIGKVLSPGPGKSKSPISRIDCNFTSHFFANCSNLDCPFSKMMFAPHATLNVSVDHFSGLENDSAK